MIMKNVLGKEGFIWWMGVVENRVDPEMLGRVQVRCFGWHTEDKEMIPSESLPWAHPIIPVNSSNVTHTPKEGDWVFGFFADGENAQHPVIMGVYTGYPVAMPDTGVGFCDPTGTYPKRLNEPTTNRLARGRSDGTVIQTRQRNAKKGVKTVGGGTQWDEPASTFAPQYPLNAAHESESGHAFELDDTPSKERVNIAHKIGTFIEFAPDGTVVTHVVKDNYHVIMGANFVSIEGVCNVTVNGDCNLKVAKNLNVEAKAINMSASGDIRLKAGGKFMTESGGATHVKSGAAMNIGGGGKLSLKGKSATIQGNSVQLAGKPSNKVKTPHGIGKIIPQGSASSPESTGLKAPK
jgi:hypothetical protein